MRDDGRICRLPRKTLITATAPTRACGLIVPGVRHRHTQLGPFRRPQDQARVLSRLSPLFYMLLPILLMTLMEGGTHRTRVAGFSLVGSIALSPELIFYLSDISSSTAVPTLPTLPTLPAFPDLTGMTELTDLNDLSEVSRELSTEMVSAFDVVRRAAIPVNVETSVAIALAEAVAGGIGGLASRRVANAIGDKKQDTLLTKVSSTGAYFGSRGLIVGVSRAMGIPRPLVRPIAALLASIVSEGTKAAGRANGLIDSKKSKSGSSLSDSGRRQRAKIRRSLAKSRHSKQTETDDALGKMGERVEISTIVVKTSSGKGGQQKISSNATLRTDSYSCSSSSSIRDGDRDSDSELSIALQTMNDVTQDVEKDFRQEEVEEVASGTNSLKRPEIIGDITKWIVYDSLMDSSFRFTRLIFSADQLANPVTYTVPSVLTIPGSSAITRVVDLLATDVSSAETGSIGSLTVITDSLPRFAEVDSFLFGAFAGVVGLGLKEVLLALDAAIERSKSDSFMQKSSQESGCAPHESGGLDTDNVLWEGETRLQKKVVDRELFSVKMEQMIMVLSGTMQQMWVGRKGNDAKSPTESSGGGDNGVTRSMIGEEKSFPDKAFTENLSSEQLSAPSPSPETVRRSLANFVGQKRRTVKTYSETALEGGVLFGCYIAIMRLLKLLIPESLNGKFLFDSLLEDIERDLTRAAGGGAGGAGIHV